MTSVFVTDYLALGPAWDHYNSVAYRLILIAMAVYMITMIQYLHVDTYLNKFSTGFAAEREILNSSQNYDSGLYFSSGEQIITSI